MRKNSYLYYLAVIGIAVAAPTLLSKFKHGAGENTAPSVSVAHAAPPPAALIAAPPAEEKLATIETSDYRAVVSGLNGGLKSFTLKDPQFRRDGKPTDVITTDKPQYYPLAPRVDGVNFAGKPWEVEQQSPQS